MDSNVLEVRNLRTYFALDEGTLKAVDGVDLVIHEHGTLGVIGESGCGKSVTAQSILRIVPRPGGLVTGEILLSRPAEEMMQLRERAGRESDKLANPLDLAQLNPRGKLIRVIRGKMISMIFQEPMTSLSPVHTIGNQIMEAILLHRTDVREEARAIAVDMLDRVGIGNSSQRIDDYPYQLSGGMRQRAMIAMALSCSPALLIADEPTTALDVTVQAQVLDLMQRLQDEFGMAIMYITHDLGVIAEIAEDVAVMYLGRVVEQGTVHQIFKDPLHPYTRLLLRSIPRLRRKTGTRLDVIEGTVPTPLDPPPECGFVDRCPEAIPGQCDRCIPALVAHGDGHQVRCFLHSDKTEVSYDPGA